MGGYNCLQLPGAHREQEAVFLQHPVCLVFWQIYCFRMPGILGIGDPSLGYGYPSATRWQVESIGFSHNFERL